MLKIKSNITTKQQAAETVVLLIFPFKPDPQDDIEPELRWNFIQELEGGKFFCYEHQFSVIIKENMGWLEIYPQWRAGEKNKEKEIAALHNYFSYIEE